VFKLTVGQAAEEALQVRHRIAQVGDTSPNAVASHQPGYPIFTDAYAACLQFMLYARAAIEAATGLMYLGDLLHQGSVLLRP
jgi:hypothetical protein